MSWTNFNKYSVVFRTDCTDRNVVCQHVWTYTYSKTYVLNQYALSFPYRLSIKLLSLITYLRAITLQFFGLVQNVINSQVHSVLIDWKKSSLPSGLRWKINFKEVNFSSTSFEYTVPNMRPLPVGSPPPLKTVSASHFRPLIRHAASVHF